MKVTYLKTSTDWVEKEIEFPYITRNNESNSFYYNYAPDKCITIFCETGSIIYSHFGNQGIDFEQVRPEEFYKAFDNLLKTILLDINK